MIVSLSIVISFEPPRESTLFGKRNASFLNNHLHYQSFDLLASSAAGRQNAPRAVDIVAHRLDQRIHGVEGQDVPDTGAEGDADFRSVEVAVEVEQMQF